MNAPFTNITPEAIGHVAPREVFAAWCRERFPPDGMIDDEQEFPRHADYLKQQVLQAEAVSGWTYDGLEPVESFTQRALAKQQYDQRLIDLVKDAAFKRGQE